MFNLTTKLARKHIREKKQTSVEKMKKKFTKMQKKFVSHELLIGLLVLLVCIADIMKNITSLPGESLILALTAALILLITFMCMRNVVL